MNHDKHILDGIRVIEVASMVYVPSAATIMSDFGAEVIKVESPPYGDIHRYGHQLPGMPVSEIPYVFQVENRNKKSIVLNLKRDEGRNILCELVKNADVFLTNYRAGALKKLQITYDDFKELNPRLIYAYGTGYGNKGPDADKPGYDMVAFWSRSGIEAQMFPMNDWLGPIPYGTGDRTSGTYLLNAILLALYDREKKGKGAKVSTSLLSAGAWTNATMIQAQLCGAQFNEKVPREKAYNFTYIYYVAKDGRPLKLNIHDQEKGWAPFCNAMGRPDLIDDMRFKTIDVRVRHMSELIAIFDEAFAQHELEYWLKVLTEYDIPHTSICTYQDIDSDPQMAASDVFVDIDHHRFGTFRTVDSPLSIEGVKKVTPETAPDLGEHTMQILLSLGYSEEEAQNFIDKGVAFKTPDE